MTITSETNKAIKYYLDRLKDGPENDKRIQNMVNAKFSVSAAAIRNKLIEEGAIELEVSGYDNKRQRNVFTVRLVNATKAKFVAEPKQKQIKSIIIDTHWPEGWRKSSGNAFDWQNTAQGLFSKQELAAMQAKIKANPGFSSGIHIYSKA